MKLSISKRLLALLAVPVFALSVASVALPAGAANNLSLRQGANSAQGDDQASCLFGNEQGCTPGQTPLFKLITNVLLFIIGAVSVIMLVIGGIRYTVSAGDSNAVTSAKNTIMYAIIGIVVSLLAFAVVNFIIGAFLPSATP